MLQHTRRRFLEAFSVALRSLVSFRLVATAGLIFLISFLLFATIDLYTAGAQIGAFSKESWRSVAGSVLAAAILLIVQELTQLVKGAEDTVYKNIYHDFVENHGLMAIFPQRGDVAAVEAYKISIGQAHLRIWAFGMTNRHFLEQHTEAVIKRLSTVDDIDIRVIFWNPSANIRVSDQNVDERSLLDVQDSIEKQSSTPSSLSHLVREKQQKLQERVALVVNPRGMMQIVDVAHGANYSCLIVDDAVFFFPFVSGPDSTNNPTIKCCAAAGIGRAIFEHCKILLSHEGVTRVVYERKGQ